MIGASFDDDQGQNSGSAYIFELDLPPFAQNDTDTVAEGGSKVIDLAANDRTPTVTSTWPPLLLSARRPMRQCRSW